MAWIRVRPYLRLAGVLRLFQRVWSRPVWSVEATANSAKGLVEPGKAAASRNGVGVRS